MGWADLGRSHATGAESCRCRCSATAPVVGNPFGTRQERQPTPPMLAPPSPDQQRREFATTNFQVCVQLPTGGLKEESQEAKLSCILGEFPTNRESSPFGVRFKADDGVPQRDASRQLRARGGGPGLLVCAAGSILCRGRCRGVIFALLQKPPLPSIPPTGLPGTHTELRHPPVLLRFHGDTRVVFMILPSITDDGGCARMQLPVPRLVILCEL
jgi:hypothetical protein